MSATVPATPAFVKADQDAINHHLKQLIDKHCDNSLRLQEAMAYSSLLGGKRIRPILVLATARCLGVSQEVALPVACAVEFIHAYSLVHDDLPAMDDDALRRGQPTCHIAFDEATAILAGDALQALAFEVLSTDIANISPARQLKMLNILAQASGATGMVAGQAIDLDSVGIEPELTALERMHRLKTGALIRASVSLGALCAEQGESLLAPLNSYAQAIGLGFQVQDDILDLTADTATLGKTQGADVALNKPTYPSLLGLDGARAKLNELHHQALAALDELEHIETSELKAIADYIVSRVF